MTRWAALLRGVNVNGRKLPMADLAALAQGLGYGAVRTLLASGNVVFDSADAAAAIAPALERALADYGLETDVVLRDGAALTRTLSANPFAEAARDRPSHLLVLFHRDPVPDAPLARLADVYDGPERMVAIGRALYIDFPAGIGDSKLTQAMVRAKSRRWRPGATGTPWSSWRRSPPSGGCRALAAMPFVPSTAHAPRGGTTSAMPPRNRSRCP